MAENTSFSMVYDSFMSKVTDDMYLEVFPDETQSMQKDLLMAAIPWFEFPKSDIFDYDPEAQVFNTSLSHEEINILAVYMVVAWLVQQMANIDVVRMKYSGSDFKLTSQAAHLKQLQNMHQAFIKEGKHLQRVYGKRMKNADGKYVSSMGNIMGVS